MNAAGLTCCLALLTLPTCGGSVGNDEPQPRSDAADTKPGDDAHAAADSSHAPDAADEAIEADTRPEGLYEKCGETWCRGECYPTGEGGVECRCYLIVGGCNDMTVCCPTLGVCTESCR